MKEVDLSNLGAPVMSRSSMSSSKVQADEAHPLQTVTRASRISFECCPDLLLEDLLHDLHLEDAFDDDEEAEDPLDLMLALSQ